MHMDRANGAIPLVDGLLPERTAKALGMGAHGGAEGSDEEGSAV